MYKIKHNFELLLLLMNFQFDDLNCIFKFSSKNYLVFFISCVKKYF